MERVFIIAEAGVNHNGNISIAKKLIDKAIEIGADAIKFQSFKTKNIVVKNSEKAQYQKKDNNSNETQFQMLNKLELTYEAHKKLFDYCEKKGIMFLSSAFDLESIDILRELDIEILKIPSGEITNLPYLEKIGSLKKKVFLSSGMSTLGEIEKALQLLNENGTTDITVLHCNTEYPTPMNDVNLKAMKTIKESFKVEIGYSDHTLGIEVAIAAVALGAKVIEKHFTLDKEMEGPDHKASLEPTEFGLMIKSIRNVEKALGDGIKKPSQSEIKNVNIVRKSIVAKKNIKKDELLTSENLYVKRPANGISPMKWYEIIGRKAKKDFNEDEMIEI